MLSKIGAVILITVGLPLLAFWEIVGLIAWRIHVFLVSRRARRFKRRFGEDPARAFLDGQRLSFLEFRQLHFKSKQKKDNREFAEWADSFIAEK